LKFKVTCERRPDRGDFEVEVPGGSEAVEEAARLALTTVSACPDTRARAQADRQIWDGGWKVRVEVYPFKAQVVGRSCSAAVLGALESWLDARGATG
jgi:hypothetical protein